MFTQLIAFAVLSIVIVIVSRHVLFNIHSHGFYRFFAWEAIAWLAVNNYSYWFEEPFSVMQIVSWICLGYALYLVVAGVVLIKTKGRAQQSREDKTLFGFEKTTALIETGIYKYIRHPLYASLVFLTWGICFKHPTVSMLVSSFFATVFLVITMKIEERENVEYFGEAYKTYIKRSKMMIPFVV